MAFSPATINPRLHPRDESPLRYRLRPCSGTLRLRITCLTSLLDQVKGQPKFWRLDLDRAAGLGRLTGLIQMDHNPATRSGGRDTAGKRLLFDWTLAPEDNALFAQVKDMQPLPGHTVTSHGIEFRLPVPVPGR